MPSVERSIVVIGVFGGEKCVRLGGAVMWDFRVQILYERIYSATNITSHLVRGHLSFGWCNNKIIRYVILGYRTRFSAGSDI